MVELRFLGSGNAFCPEGRMHSLVLIDGHLLIDAPPTLIPQLRRAGVSPADIDSLLITHWHADHIFGFPFLVLDRRFQSDREGEKTLEVHLHNGGQERLRHLCELGFPGSLEEVLDERVNFHHGPSGDVCGSPDGWTFERFPVNHTPETEPHGYQLTHPSGFTLIHCGDSGPCREIEMRAPLADVVIIELGLPDYVDSDYHYKPKTLSKLAEECPETCFLATHLFTASEGSGVATIPSLPSNVIEVSDGDGFEWNEAGLSRVSN
jgi:ribonuclease BN (tRNA processing enzyme)